MRGSRRRMRGHEEDEAMMNDRAIASGGLDRVKTVAARDLELEPIRDAVRGIRYGEVRVIIQDGVIVQIERLEKQRFR